MFFEARQQHLAQFLNARFVLRIANVDNLAVAAISRIFDNAV
ncbi:bifunctional polymyxin resistance ArnA domain protein [Escherichia coli P0302308.2]|nr:bifunctional polymyxin resistance ArnA domain protein [Escherichia coli P0302308.2]